MISIRALSVKVTGIQFVFLFQMRTYIDGVKIVNNNKYDKSV